MPQEPPRRRVVGWSGGLDGFPTGPDALVRCLDLGCGRQDRPGFVGIDRFPFPEVDLVADLERPLPLRDDSFDLIVAIHSLEHVGDLRSVLREIWRVGRPGAQVCVAGPYWAQGIHVANPYHVQNFNEHSPRFWTCDPRPPIAARDYARPPQGAQWGLAASDNSRSDFDLRCLRMEFFYFEEYWGLAPERLSQLRRRGFDVCEQILYHLAVFKPPLREEDLGKLDFEPFDPPFLAERRRLAAAAPKRRFSLRRLLAHLLELGRE